MRLLTCVVASCWMALCLWACGGEPVRQSPVSGERSTPIAVPSYEPTFAPPIEPVDDVAPPAEPATQPEATGAGACEVERVTLLRRVDPQRFELSAVLRSRVSRPITLRIQRGCPGGAARFLGLPDGYDYFGVCNAGACMTPVTEQTLILEPGGMQTIDTVTLNVDGDTCQPRLDRQRYAVGFELALDGVGVCDAERVTLDLGPTRMPARPIVRQPVPKPTPQPTLSPTPAPKQPAPRDRCPPMPACGIACPGGSMARDENGCSLCACAPMTPIEILRAP